MSDLWARESLFEGDPDPAETSPPATRQVLSVRQVNEEIAAAVARSFPETVWVRGEVQRFPQDAARRTHVYFELHETGASGAAEYQLAVSLMGWDRQRFGLGRYLDGGDPNFQFANKLEVCLECKVDFYAKFGKLSLKVVGVDTTFALGRLEARRRETLAHLAKHQLLDLNAQTILPDLPLRVGLITSPGSAAEQDFRTGLDASPWPFTVTLAGARMQGAQLETEVIGGLAKLAVAGVDVIVITRGGGSRADLSWFDQQALAEAIARSQVPVVTAIGHEIDQAIADMVAHTSCKTPTAAAEFLVDRVSAAAQSLDDVTLRLQAVVEATLAEAQERLELGPRFARAVVDGLRRARLRYQAGAGRLQHLVSGSLAVRQSRLADLRVRLGATAMSHLADGRAQVSRLTHDLGGAALARVQGAQARMAERQARLAREAVRPCGPWSRRLADYTTQVRLLDPTRLLQRGYTITLGPDGKAARAAGSLAPGDTLTTVLVDGQVKSIVQPGGDAGSPEPGKAKKRGGKKDKTDSGQSTLFQ